MLDVTNRFPWNAIEDRTVLGNAMRFIPKFYIKHTQGQNGLFTKQISNVKKSGFHIYPAFMKNGHEIDGILLGKYLTSGTAEAPASVENGTTLALTLANCQTAGNALNTGADDDHSGWHMMNIYEYHLQVLLALTECGTANIPYALTGTEGVNTGTISYLGIENAFYTMWLDGIDTMGSNDTTLRIMDNKGNGTMVDTEIALSGLANGYFTSLMTNSGENYDLNDLFIADGSSQVSTIDNGTFGDVQYLQTGGQGVESSGSTYPNYGPFYLATNDVSYRNAFRLAKFA